MSITKQKKEEILENLKESLKKAKIVVFVNFHGLSVSLANELRKILRSMGVTYMVAKKTLIKKALETFGFSGEMPKLEGEIAIAVSDSDPLASAKALEQFAKKNKDKIKLGGGVFENKYIGAETVIMLANIPAREILLGQLVNIINSPIQGLVVTLNGLVSKFVRTLEEIAKKKS
ncbi:MAG: 50S ribosomal protein L10 [Candidatus Terrybacteria bacterium]|nr:50S ribosomal protein L10 [Candidatus Terrybacteria bacterium]